MRNTRRYRPDGPRLKRQPGRNHPSPCKGRGARWAGMACLHQLVSKNKRRPNMHTDGVTPIEIAKEQPGFVSNGANGIYDGGLRDDIVQPWPPPLQ